MLHVETWYGLPDPKVSDLRRYNLSRHVPITPKTQIILHNYFRVIDYMV